MLFRAWEIYKFARFPVALFITADWSSHFWGDFRPHDSQRQKFKFRFENFRIRYLIFLLKEKDSKIKSDCLKQLKYFLSIKAFKTKIC